MTTARQRRDTSQPASDPMMAAAEAAVAADQASKAATPDAPVPAPFLVPDPETPLAARLAAIAMSIGDQAKDAWNKDQRFAYFAAEQVYGWWRERLQRAGIIVIPRLVRSQFHAGLKYKSGGEHMITVLDYEFDFTDGRERLTFGPVQGQGDDSSDKGSGKALTYALKSLLLAMGMNASESDDVEDDSHDEATARANQAGVVVGDSDIQGIQRGGRSTNANDTQIRRLRDLYQKKELTFEDAQDVAKDVLGETLELDDAEGAPEPGAQLLAFFRSLSSEDIGKFIVEFEKFDDPADPSLGYGG